MVGRHRPQPPQLGRDAREHDHPGRADRHHEPRCGAGDAQHLRARGNLRLLAVARVEPVAVEPVAHGDLVGPPVDPGQHVRVELELDAGDLRQRLDRAVVVGRAETARRHDEIGGLEHQAHARPDVLEIVPHHQRAPHREALPFEGGCQVRPVLVGDHPAQELVAREQDGGGRPAQAGCAPEAVRRTRCGEATLGSDTWRPSIASVTLPGAPSARKIALREVERDGGMAGRVDGEAVRRPQVEAAGGDDGRPVRRPGGRLDPGGRAERERDPEPLRRGRRRRGWGRCSWWRAVRRGRRGRCSCCTRRVGWGGKRRASTTRNDTATIAASAIMIRFDSRRWRRRCCGRDRGRDVIGWCSMAPRGSWWRELNSSTNGWPSRPRYSA